MTHNDEQIRNLLTIIEKKKLEVGEKPNAYRKSNGLFKSGDSHVNINTLLTIDACVRSVATILKEKSVLKEAARYLGVEHKEDLELDSYLEDIKLRASIIKWEAEKKKLDILEKQLKDLRSEHARTADALTDITKQLSL